MIFLKEILTREVITLKGKIKHFKEHIPKLKIFLFGFRILSDQSSL
jgi:hypothetical protein